jgi:uncharacterized phage protein (TIGR01671 family)
MENRIIKFRAFVAGKMHYDVSPFAWDYVLDLSMHKCVRSTGNGILGSGGREATFELNGYGSQTDLYLMQFTGLIDKNGKNVFEGDILKDGKGGNGVVVYAAPQFVVQVEGSQELYSLAEGKVNIKQLEYTEVVGNIYENNELLK